MGKLQKKFPIQSKICLIYLQHFRISSSELVQFRFNCGKYKRKHKRYGALDRKWRLSNLLQKVSETNININEQYNAPVWIQTHNPYRRQYTRQVQHARPLRSTKEFKKRKKYQKYLRFTLIKNKQLLNESKNYTHFMMH